MKEHLVTLWDRLNTQQRRTMILVGVLALVMIVVIVSRSFTSSWTLLYGGLDSETAGLLVQELKNRGVAYRLEQQGTSVMVPKDQLYELRLQLASEGLPGNTGIGFEVFDRSSLPGTEFANRVNLQRALQGELSRSINCLEEVAASRVHLVMPEESLFSESPNPSASVVLTLKPGRRISDQQVAALVNLVSSAVGGLEPESVTIVDARGAVLASGADGAEGRGGLDASQLEITREFEERLRRGLQSMLDAAIGQHRSVVQVQAELNFDSERRRSETYLGPEGKSAGLKTEHVSEETYDSNRTPGGGQAGVSSNIMGGTTSTTDGQEGKYLSREETREYELSKETVEKTIAGSSVNRMTVAVVVDESVKVGDLDMVENIVAAACGCDVSRGDEVVVARMPLAAKTVAEEAVKEAEDAEKSRSRRKLFTLLARYGSALAMVIVLGAVMLVVSRRLHTVSTGEPHEEVEELEEADLPALSDGETSSEDVVDIQQQADDIKNIQEQKAEEDIAMSDEELIEQIRALTQQQVGSVAQQIEEMVKGNG